MKNKSINILLKILIFMLLINIFMYTSVKAFKEPTEQLKLAMLNPDDFAPSDIEGYEQITETGGIIIDVIRTIGFVISVIVLLIMGIKYMTGTVSEKAEYKKTMIPYIIGVAIFFSLSTILTTIIEIVANIE